MRLQSQQHRGDGNGDGVSTCAQVPGHRLAAAATLATADRLTVAFTTPWFTPAARVLP